MNTNESKALAALSAEVVDSLSCVREKLSIILSQGDWGPDSAWCLKDLSWCISELDPASNSSLNVNLLATTKQVPDVGVGLSTSEITAFRLGSMESAPCFRCGYNGPGYFQPDMHKCAKYHHALVGLDQEDAITALESQPVAETVSRVSGYRQALEMVRSCSINPAHTMTKNGLEECLDACNKVASQALAKGTEP